MKVGIIHEAIPFMYCVFCEFTWAALVECVEIDLDSHCEYLYAEELVCPNCQIITPIIREENEY